MSDLENVVFVPIRHHSPRTALCLSELIRREQPSRLLVEGPSDASHLIPFIVEEGTVPPVAILSYSRNAEITNYVAYPLADYSPEYVALKEGSAIGAEVEFFDVPSIEFLNRSRTYEQVEGATTSIYERVSDQLGYRSFEEFWEANFESRTVAPERHFELLREFGLLAREYSSEDEESRRFNAVREAFMISRLLERAASAEKIFVIWGAFHDAGFVSRDYNLEPAKVVADQCEIENTLIPYSFARLSEQSGYGAGNRAPFFYQSVYDKRGDFQRVTLEVLSEFSKNLRLRGYMASLSDTIEAYRLVRVLAVMRDKEAPGIDEIKEATVACLMHGASQRVEDFLWRYLVGTNIGKVSERVGKNSLQQEFYNELRARRLPLEDEVNQFILTLTNDLEIGTSVFLHRLRLAEIPYGGMVAQKAARNERLSSLKEKWEVRWSPAVDVALLEKIVLGGSLIDVCARLLFGRIQECKSLPEATEILKDAILTNTVSVLGKALEVIDAQSNIDEDFHHLSVAASHLLSILSYSSSRRLDPARFSFLLEKLYTRAVLSMNQNAGCSDQACESILEGMKLLNDVVTRNRDLDRQLFLEELNRVATSFAAHQKVAGLALSILNLNQAVSEEELITQVSQRLSYGTPPMRAVQFLEGFLSINKLVLVKNRSLVGWLNRFIENVSPSDFVQLLPVLRACFASTSRAELQYLIENLLDVIGVAGEAEAEHIIKDKGLETLAEMDGELGSLLDDLDKLL